MTTAPSQYRAIGSGPPARQGRATRRAWPIGVSVALHAVLLGALSLVVWEVVPRAHPGRDVNASFDDPGMAPSGRPTPAAVASTAPAAPARERPVAAALPAPDASALAAPAISDLAPPSFDVVALPALPAPADSPALAGPVGLPEVRFSGHGASDAASVVYVVDASGSMVATFPIVKDELMRSISRLDPAQRFQVVFFQKGGYLSAPHPADGEMGARSTRLIRATSDNVKVVLAWIESITPGGTSDPMRALEVALGLEPDAVFLLSSAITGLGRWEPDKARILSDLDSRNPADARGGRAVVIKTIQFLDQDPSGILQAIGEAHGGSGGGYLYKSREDLGL